MKKTQIIQLISLFAALTIILIAAAVLTFSSPPASDTVLPTRAVLPPATAVAVIPTALPTDEPSQEAVASALLTEEMPLAAAPLTGNTSFAETVESSEPTQIELPSEPVPNQIVITFAPDATDEDKRAYVEGLGGEIVRDIDALDTVVITVPDQVTAQTLPSSDLVQVSEPDYFVAAQFDIPPSDALYTQQWALPVINAPAAWAELPANAPALTVAVLDSGVCASHPDLQGRVVPGYDFVDGDADPQDEYGHGCAVTGVIAANIDNGAGIAGVAPNTQILPLRVLNASGVGTYSAVSAAIVYAADSGADIINLSLGGASPSTTLASAVDYAIDSGALVIAAAGNTNGGAVLYPAKYAPVIAVGSVDSNLQPSSFSASGSEIDLWAPGRSILTTRRDGAYSLWSGTSFAAPNAAGVAALELARGRTLALGGLLAASGAPAPQTTPEATPPQEATPDTSFDHLMQIAQRDGVVRIIVGLNVGFRPEGELSAQDAQAQRQDIAQAQQQLLTNLSAFSVQVMAQSDQWIIPYIALLVDAPALQYLASAPEVTSIVEDYVAYPTLLESTALIGAATAWAEGFDGSGQTIAILDNGFQVDHPFFTDRVVEQACYSTPTSTITDTPLCPNGLTSQTTTGVDPDPADNAADPSETLCNTVNFGVGCDHGTHVAGIAAGADGPGGLNGVANNANLILVQVFVHTTAVARCGSGNTCLVSFASDQVSGLLQVYALRTSYDIAAVNMSLGFPFVFTSACDGSFSGPLGLTATINTLRSEGIQTIAAAGNNSSSTGINAPACISTVVAVSAVDDDDEIAGFANNSAQTDLLAPGVFVNSSDTGTNSSGDYEVRSGTSMAAPHVAGAYALLRQRNPSIGVDDIQTALKNAGVPVLDTRNSVTKPRIDIPASFAEFDCTICADLAVTIDDDPDPVDVSSGITQTVTYTVTVSNSSTASSTETATNVVLTNTLPDDVTFVDAVPTAGTCNDPTGGVFTCDLGDILNGQSVQIDVTVETTANTLSTITNTASATSDTVDGNSGNNQESEDTTVILSSIPVLAAPADGALVTTRTPLLDWSDIANATGYVVQYGKLNPPGTVPDGEIELDASASEYTPPPLLVGATYFWRVRAKIGMVYSDWSDTWSVEIKTSSTTTVPKPNMVFDTRTPTLTWNSISWATGYEIQIATSSTFWSGSLVVPTTSVGTDLFFTTPPLANGFYYWRVRALNGATPGPWSSAGSFTVDVP